MLTTYLQDIGLSEKEAALYIALLAHDHASVAVLAEKTGIKRPTVYVTLEALERKGLVSQVLSGKKTLYRAEEPERLNTFIEHQKVLLEEQKKRLEEYIPAFRAIEKQSGEKPIVKYFEGKEGIIAMYKEFYDRTRHEQGGRMDLIFPMDATKELFTKEESKALYDERMKRQIASRFFFTSTEQDALSGATLVDGKKIQDGNLLVTADISIYKDQVEVTTFGKNPSGIFIKCKDFADTMRTLFELAWKNTEGR